MIPHLFYYHLMVLGLLWLCVMLHYVWPSPCTVTQQRSAEYIKPPRQRTNEPAPFAGLTHKPPCAACEQATDFRPQVPGAPPPLITSTRGRKHRINMPQQFCPDQSCRYFG